MTAGGTFDAVVSDVAEGATVPRAARRAGIPLDLAAGMVAEAERLGLLMQVPAGCGGCGNANARAATAAAGCVTCPLPRVGTSV